jgi:hypothetical protein
VARAGPIPSSPAGGLIRRTLTFALNRGEALAARFHLDEPHVHRPDRRSWNACIAAQQLLAPWIAGTRYRPSARSPASAISPPPATRRQGALKARR